MAVGEYTKRMVKMSLALLFTPSPRDSTYGPPLRPGLPRAFQQGAVAALALFLQVHGHGERFSGLVECHVPALHRGGN